MKTSIPSRLGHLQKIGALSLAVLAGVSPVATQAADIHWIGGTASYTNAPNWSTATVPGAADNAIATNGAGNIIQINVGDPDWTVNDLSAGGVPSGAGAYTQNGQTVNVNGWMLIGSAANGTGSYTLNDGTLNILGGRLFLGDQPGSASSFTMNGGVLNKTGDFIVLGDGGWNGAGARTAVFTQTAGTINSTSEFQVGNVPLSDATYNLTGGTNNVDNWFAVGRFGGKGTLNVSGGRINKTGGGNFYVGEDVGTGQFDFTGGTIDINSEYWLGNGGTSIATQNMSGASSLTVGNWIAIGRNGGAGTLNLTNGTITKIGSGNLAVGAGGGAGAGLINQYGGLINNTANPASFTYLAENGGNGTWNMYGGTATLGVLQFCQGGNGTGLLNLNGGLLNVLEVNCGISGANGTLNFNGGTLQANADNANFFSGLGAANVDVGGAVIDSQGFNITVGQTLADIGGGGLTKLGSGKLTLTGNNSYSGTTLVSAGTLAITTDATASSVGGYAVASGATLAIKVQFDEAQLNTASATFNSGTPAIEFDLGNFGNPTAAPMNLTGDLAANGTTTIHLLDGLPQIGQFPLIKYATRSGAGGFVLGTLPVGVVASIVTNVGNSSIDINITSVNLPRWDGQAGGNWDVGLTTNWVNFGTGLPTFFGQGNAVLFNDSAAGVTTANLVTTVNPSSVTIDNSSLSYTLSGSGKIGGSTSLTKQGSGVATIANTGGNDFTGKTIVSGGTLSVTSLANGGSPSSIGASSAVSTNLQLNGGTLDYSGAATTVNRGYSLNSGVGTVSVQNALTLSGQVTAAAGTGSGKSGPGSLKYTTAGLNTHSGSGSITGYQVGEGAVTFDGSAAPQTNVVNGPITVTVASGSSASLLVTNAVLTGTSTLVVSNGAEAQFVSGSVLNLSGGGFNINSGGIARFSGGTLNIGNNLTVVPNTLGATGTLFITSGTITKTGGRFSVGNVNGDGAVYQSGGTINSTSELWVGNRENTGGATATGEYYLSGGALNVTNWIAIGRFGGQGTFNMTGGSLTKSGNGDFVVGVSGGAQGTINHSGGTINSTKAFLVPENGSATTLGTYNLSGSGVFTISSWVAIGRGNGVGAMTMSGGLFAKTADPGSSFIIAADGPGTFTQTGGSLSNTISQTWIGENRPATWTMSGGSATLGFLQFGRNGGGTGVLDFNGGLIAATEIAGGAGLATNNYNGGTIRARASTANFLHDLDAANVLAGGLTIDTDTNTIGVAQALLDGGGSGGLTKTGSGTLRLNGVNTYTGNTTVNAGTLGGIGTIAGPVSVAAGATLAPGTSIGTLTINNTLTLAAGSTNFIEVSYNGGTTNNDLVTGLTGVSYAGSLVVTNIGSNALPAGYTVFKLFNSAAPGSGNFSSVTVLPSGTGTFNPATGELTVFTVGPLNVNNLTTVGGNLILTGNGGTIGGSYSVLTATDAAAPASAWTTNQTGTFNGGGAFSNAIPINTSEPARFFRVKMP